MADNFKPLLASPVDFAKLDYDNVWGSPKLDGIRAIVRNSVVYSRKLLPIPSTRVQALFGRSEFEGLDGELGVGDPTSKTFYNDTYRGVMKKNADVDATFHVFDDTTIPETDYQDRLDSIRLRLRIASLGLPMSIVEQRRITSEASLLEYEAYLLALGYEGMMLRKFWGPYSHYKFGRSTPLEGTLLKLKRFSDKEAVIVGVEEEMANNNVATTDELGRTKRSSHQENKSGKGRLGALVCKTPEGVIFNIGTGYDAKMRDQLWRERETLPGQYVKYKSFDIGVVDAPRFPVFLGLRSAIDM